VTTPRGRLTAGQVILTTGGLSYPGSGTTGDGYGFLAAMGHTIVPPRPALAPITVSVPWITELRGMTMPDIVLRILEQDRCLASRRGSLLFAHFGLTGPAALDVSRVVSGHPRPEALVAEMDFLPALKDEALADFLRAEAIASGKKQVAGVLTAHLPR